MAKLYFKFGAMGSSKTAQALMTKFNYEEKGQTVWLVKPATDLRDDVVDENGVTHTVIKSRIGLFAEAEALPADLDIYAEYLRRGNGGKYADAIICDECQFLTGRQVEQLKDLADRQDVPVLCFGLRADFQTLMFPGSKRLFEIADSITEIKSICRCGRKATVNARFDDDGQIITDGEQVCLGGNDRYEGMCYKCYRALVEDKLKSEGR
ncbi:MAG: thymidine kinase [Clostridia bacterium]|nr:thymidine kinase [Clostridia bacterium]MBR4799578.1 thymidine kinase [Clostridia bacterium]MBR5747115.1 thymidine kinase [Clostridia bacterium]